MTAYQFIECLRQAVTEQQEAPAAPSEQDEPSTSAPAPTPAAETAAAPPAPAAPPAVAAKKPPKPPAGKKPRVLPPAAQKKPVIAPPVVPRPEDNARTLRSAARGTRAAAAAAPPLPQRPKRGAVAATPAQPLPRRGAGAVAPSPAVHTMRANGLKAGTVARAMIRLEVPGVSLPGLLMKKNKSFFTVRAQPSVTAHVHVLSTACSRRVFRWLVRLQGRGCRRSTRVSSPLKTAPCSLPSWSDAALCLHEVMLLLSALVE